MSSPDRTVTGPEIRADAEPRTEIGAEPRTDARAESHGGTGAGSRTEARVGAGMVGLGAVACAACCAGPIVGFLAAAGVTAVLGTVVFGVAGLAVVAVVVAVLGCRRRARRCAPSPSENGPVRVDPPRLAARSGPRDGA